MVDIAEYFVMKHRQIYLHGKHYPLKNINYGLLVK